MIKRVFWVALFTGSSHLIALLTISYVIRNLGEEVSGYIGVIDSTLVLIASVISFGVQLAVNRNVATKSGWKSNYSLAQSARLMLSAFVVLFGAILFITNREAQYLIYFFGPLVALNGDYALYGNGKPIIASSLSFLRVAAPNIGLVVAAEIGGMNFLDTYILLLAVGILIAGIISSRVNNVPYLYLPRKSFARFYLKYIKVGGYQVASALIVPGILVIADWFYTIAFLGLINGLLKILIIYKGGLRIIVQAFFKELSLKETAVKIDKASLLVWGLASIPVMIYYKTTLNLLFDDKLDQISIMLPLIGLVMFFGAFRNSSEVRALMLRKDNLNLFTFLFALGIQTGLLVGLSYTDYFSWGVPLGLLAAEVIATLGLGIGLGGFSYFKKRLAFILQMAPPLLISVALFYLIENKLIGLSVSVVIYALWSLIFFRRLIFEKLSN